MFDSVLFIADVQSLLSAVNIFEDNINNQNQTIYYHPNITNTTIISRHNNSLLDISYTIQSNNIIDYCGWINGVNSNNINKNKIDVYKYFNDMGIPYYKEDISVNLLKLQEKMLQNVHNNQYRKECPKDYIKCAKMSCGFGCQLDKLIMCSNYALTRNKVFDYQLSKEYGNWSSVLKPMNNLRQICNKSSFPRQIKFSINGKKKDYDKYRYFIPKKFKNETLKYHKIPELFYTGVMDSYLLRLNTHSMNVYNNMYSKFFCQKNYSQLSMHIRRTDKTKEASIWELNDYNALIKYFNTTNMYIGCDDVNVVSQMEKLYNIKFSEYSFSKINNTLIKTQRKSKNALISIIMDILLLRNGDYFIGQDSSRISKTVFQLFSIKLKNYVNQTASIDHYKKHEEVYFFWWMI